MTATLVLDDRGWNECRFAKKTSLKTKSNESVSFWGSWNKSSE